MKFRGVSVKIPAKFRFSIPKIYSDNEWKQANCFVFRNNEWVPIGAACTQMLWLQDANGNQVYSDGQPFLVREPWDSNTV